MAFPLYQRLTDSFDRHDGSLSPYVNSSNIPLPYEKHYDLRMFHTSNLTVPWTAADNSWWAGYKYPTFGTPQIGTLRSIVNVTSRGRTQSELDAITQTQLDAFIQNQLDNVVTSNGNEEWPITDADVTIGKDSAYRYSNTIRANLSVGSFTGSGNEITDATRATASSMTTASSGQMFDGLTNDSSFGIRRAATNLFRRGQCDSITDWNTGGAGTMSRAIDATVPAPFSPQSIKFTVDGSLSQQGTQPTSANGLAAPTGTVAASSIWFMGVAGQTYFANTTWVNTDASQTIGASGGNFTATGSWQLITPPTVAVAAGKTGDRITTLIRTVTARAESFWAAHAMLESGQTVVAPYVASSGGAIATHAAGRVQAPASLLNATQGWVAMRLRLGFDSTNTVRRDLFNWQTDASNLIRISVSAANKLTVQRLAAGVGELAQTAVLTYAAGDIWTVIARWDGSAVYASKDGAAFTSTVGAHVPTLPSTFDIGSDPLSVGKSLDSDVFWLATGTGTLTDADAGTINSMGNVDPVDLRSFAASGTPTALWKAKTLAYNTSKTITSFYRDDIRTDFNDSDYQIELVLRSLPSQADAAHLDLLNSSIDVSSDINFPDGQTDRLFFVNSTNSLTGTTGTFDTVARWPLASLVKADRSALRAIRFNLVANESMTFIAQALRIVPNNWSARSIGVDTKRQQLARQIPKVGGAEPVSFLGKNMIENGDFEEGIIGVGGNGNSTTTWDSTAGKFGTSSLRITQTAAGQFWAASLRSDVSRIPVNAGQTYTASAWYRNVSGNAEWYTQVNFYDSGGSFIGQLNGTIITGAQLLGGVWRQSSVTGVAPANAASCLVQYTTTASSTTGAGSIGQADGARLDVGTQVLPFYLDDGLYFYQTRPKNVTTYTLFNSGHAPATGTDDNILRQFYRHDPTTGNRIEVRLSSRSTQTRLFIDHRIGGVTTNLVSTGTLTNILTAETDYYLVVTLKDGAITANVYTVNGLALGTLVGTLTASVTTTLLARGYVGMSFEPYNYDFTVRSIGTNTADFGTFLSTNFASRTPVLGATLYPRTSPSVNLLSDGALEAFGDATMTTSTDGITQTVVRSGSYNQGGIRYNTPQFVGDSSQVVVQGKIFPVTQLRGTYRIGLIDENDSVAWSYNFTNLIANQWNNFSILLPAVMNPVGYYFHIQQFGNFADTFRVRELSVSHATIGWEATANGGTNWQPFLNVVDDRWSAVKFGTTGKSLAVRATAKSDRAYISGYNLVPRYIA